MNHSNGSKLYLSIGGRRGGICKVRGRLSLNYPELTSSFDLLSCVSWALGSVITTSSLSVLYQLMVLFSYSSSFLSTCLALLSYTMALDHEMTHAVDSWALELCFAKPFVLEYTASKDTLA